MKDELASLEVEHQNTLREVSGQGNPSVDSNSLISV